MLVKKVDERVRQCEEKMFFWIKTILIKDELCKKSDLFDKEYISTSTNSLLQDQ